MKKITTFFGIRSPTYTFEITDISALLTVLNVFFILCGWRFAPVFGLINCALTLLLFVRGTTHINAYIIQVALIVLNIYFLF